MRYELISFEPTPCHATPRPLETRPLTRLQRPQGPQGPQGRSRSSTHKAAHYPKALNGTYPKGKPTQLSPPIPTQPSPPIPTQLSPPIPTQPPLPIPHRAGPLRVYCPSPTAQPPQLRRCPPQPRTAPQPAPTARPRIFNRVAKSVGHLTPCISNCLSLTVWPNPRPALPLRRYPSADAATHSSESPSPAYFT